MTQMPPDIPPASLQAWPRSAWRDWQRQTTQWWRGASSAWSWGLSPIAAQLAATDWWLHWVHTPEHAQAAWPQWAWPALDHGTTSTPAITDPRYAHTAWQQWPYQTLKDQHTRWGEHLLNQTQLNGMQPHHQQLMRFMTRQWVDLAAPANWPFGRLPKPTTVAKPRHGIQKSLRSVEDIPPPGVDTRKDTPATLFNETLQIAGESPF